MMKKVRLTKVVKKPTKVLLIKPTTQWNKKKKRVPKSRRSNQHNIITKLPTEILIDIVNRLPTTAIASCLACDNRELNSVISKSNFPHRTTFFSDDLDRPYVHPSGTWLVEYRIDDNKIVSTPFNMDSIRGFKNPKHNILRILLSCNGWLLVHSWLPRLQVDHYSLTKQVLHLVNPVTRRCLSLPMDTIKIPLGFTLSDGPEYGMGCSRTTGEYKVVRLTKMSHNSDSCVLWNVQVLESGRNNRKLKWRPMISRHKLAFGGLIVVGDPWPVALHGAIYWKLWSTETKYWTLLRLDIDKEVLDLVGLPQNDGDMDFLGSVGDSLCVSITTYEQQGWTRRRVWVMKEYGVEESWTVLFSIRHDFGSVLHVFEDSRMLITTWIPCKLTSWDDDSREYEDDSTITPSSSDNDDKVYMYHHNNNKGSQFQKVELSSNYFNDGEMRMLHFVPNYKL